jgi:glycosyltransferase involved in cell wall biosynthesis
MRLAYLSPLPPASSGIADYSAELLPALADRVESIEVVVSPDGIKPSLAAHPRITLVDEARFIATAERGEYDAIFYQHGNNELHAHVHRLAQRFPGISVLHDGVLHHFVAHQHLANEPKDWAGYANALEQAEGAAGRRFAKLRQAGLTANWQVFLLPVVEQVVTASRGVLVHSAEGQAMVRRRFESKPLRRAHHHYSVPPPHIDSLSKEAAREKLGLPREAFIVGSFGFVTPSKRVEVALRGFAAARPQLGDSLFVIVGRRAEFDESVIEALGITPQVRMPGSVPMEEFLTYLIAVDVVVNLRYPYGGESSGTLMRALGAGKACLVSKMPMWADFPDDVTGAMPVGEGEVEALAAALIALKSHPEERVAMGERARRYARLECSLERSVDAYLALARQTAPSANADQLKAMTAALVAVAAQDDRARWKEAGAATPILEALATLRRWQVKDVIVVGEPGEVAKVLSAQLGSTARVHHWTEEGPIPMLKTADAAVVLAWHRDFLPSRDAQAARWVASPQRRLQVVPGRVRPPTLA